jgi:hypothetical protein
MTWNLHQIRGSREAVKAAVNKEKSVPDAVKAWICAEVDALSAEVPACRLDAYCQDLHSARDMQSKRIIQFTLTSIQL